MKQEIKVRERMYKVTYTNEFGEICKDITSEMDGNNVLNQYTHAISGSNYRNPIEIKNTLSISIDKEQFDNMDKLKRIVKPLNYKLMHGTCVECFSGCSNCDLKCHDYHPICFRYVIFRTKGTDKKIKKEVDFISQEKNNLIIALL